MTAKTRFRLLLWPVLIALVALGWWGLIVIGVPWWAVPLGVLAFIGVLGIVGWWIGALENAAKQAKAERERAESAEADAWDAAARRLLTEEERERTDPKGCPDGDA